MMTFDYVAWLKTAEDRLEVLYEQKANIEAEISALEDGIQGFSPLLQRPYNKQWLGQDVGITDAVREVFKAEPNRLFAPTEIKQLLLDRGVDLSQKNPMATIHQILARLVQKGTVKISVYENGRNRYQWVPESKPLVPVPEGRTRPRHRG